MHSPMFGDKVYDLPIDIFVPYPGNPRIGDVDAIARSLQVNGQYRPIVVRRDTREILAGNHTWKAAKSLGWETILVTYVDGITDTQAARIVLADNRFGDLGSYNVPDLTALLDSLPSLEGTGYDDYVAVNLESAFTKPEISGTLSNSEDIMGALPKAITCPNCSHTWEK